MKLSQQNTQNLQNLPNSNNNIQRVAQKGTNMIQKPIRAECLPKNYSNNSFTLNNTQPFALGVKRNSIEPTSITQRQLQANKKNAFASPYGTNFIQKENINFTSQFTNSLAQNNTKGSQNILQQNNKNQIQNNLQQTILNTSGQNLNSSRVQTHQFEQKLIQQQQNIQQLTSQLTIQPIDFLEMNKGDLQLSQVLSPTQSTRLNTSSTTSHSKEKMQSSKNFSKINCKNHTNIQASFYCIENRVVSYYCTHCSASLVQKGLKVHEIVNMQMNPKVLLNQINLNVSSGQQQSSTISTPMKLSLGQHKMINLNNSNNLSGLQKNQIQQQSKNQTNTNSPTPSLLTPRQQSTTIPVSVFEPFSNAKNKEESFVKSQYQNVNLSTLGDKNDDDYEESLDFIIAKNNIKLQDEKIKVKEHIEDLLKKIDHLKAMSYNVLNKIQGKKLQMHDFYEMQKQIVLEKILEFITIIEEEKQNSLKNIDIEQQDNLVIYDTIESTLKQQIKDARNISCDIKDNISNIFTNLDLKPFKVIYNKYNDKLEQFVYNINKIENTKVEYSILNSNQISNYKNILKDLSMKAFELEKQQDLISNNLIQNIQTMFPQLLNNSNILQSPLNNDINKLDQQKEFMTDISQEDTPRNDLDVCNNLANPLFNRKSSRGDQVYVSFNNKNIFQNDLSSNTETLEDEYNKESIPMVQLNIQQNKKNENNKLPQNKKPNGQKTLKDDNNDIKKGFHPIKEENINDRNNISIMNQATDLQLIQNQLKNTIDSNPNQFCKNLVNSQQEYGLGSNYSKDSIELDQGKQNSLLRQASPQRNSFNSSTTKSRNLCKSPNSQKYLELIDKINTNQLNTNNFYSTLIKDNQILTSQSDTNSQKQSITASNTFAVKIQKLQTNGDSDNQSLLYSTKHPHNLPELNTSLNIQTSQVIFSDTLQQNLKHDNNIINFMDINSISPINVTPTNQINIVNGNGSTKPLSPNVAKTFIFPNTQLPQHNHNYQKKLF